MRISLKSVVLLLAMHLPSFGGEEVKQQIAEAFGYPAERLTLSDRSSEVAETSKGNYLSVIDLKSEDDSFATTELAISKRGVMLKPEIEACCEKAIADGAPGIKKFELPEGGYGYTGLGMGGPGGSEERITATWPEMGIDLQVKVRHSRDGLMSDAQTKHYHEMVMQGGQGLTEKMIDIANHLARYAQERKLYIASEPRAGNSPKPRPPAATETSRAPSKQPEDSANSSESSRDSRWPWIIGIVALLVMLAFFFKRRG